MKCLWPLIIYSTPAWGALYLQMIGCPPPVTARCSGRSPAALVPDIPPTQSSAAPTTSELC